MTNFVKEKRIGRFFLDDKMVEKNPEDVMAILGSVIVTSAKHTFGRGYEYVAFGPQFEPHSRVDYPPTYVPSVEAAGKDELFVVWRKP